MTYVRKLPKADIILIELAMQRDLLNDVSENAETFSLIHTSSPRIEKLVANGFFEAIPPSVSGRRSMGYALTHKGRAAYTQSSGA